MFEFRELLEFGFDQTGTCNMTMCNKYSFSLDEVSMFIHVYTWKKLGNTSCVTRVNFGLLFSYNLNMY